MGHKLSFELAVSVIFLNFKIKNIAFYLTFFYQILSFTFAFRNIVLMIIDKKHRNNICLKTICKMSNVHT